MITTPRGRAAALAAQTRRIHLLIALAVGAAAARTAGPARRKAAWAQTGGAVSGEPVASIPMDLSIAQVKVATGLTTRRCAKQVQDRIAQLTLAAAMGVVGVEMEVVGGAGTEGVEEAVGAMAAVVTAAAVVVVVAEREVVAAEGEA